jgi:site-specific recombinase XerD
MPSFNGPYEKKGKWYAYAYDADRQPPQKWFSLKTADKQTARQKLAQRERECAMGEWDPWTGQQPGQEDILLREGIDRYLDACRRAQHTDSTVNHKRKTLTRFAEILPERIRARAVRGKHVRRHLDQVTGRNGGSPSPHTIRGYASNVSAFFSWLIEQGYAEDNPVEGIALPSQPETEREALRPGDLDAIRAAVFEDIEENPLRRTRSYLPNIFDFYAATGLRKNELPALPLAHCHLRCDSDGVPVGGYIEVKAFEDPRTGFTFAPKWGKPRRVELYPRPARILHSAAGERLGALEDDGQDAPPRFAPAFLPPHAKRRREGKRVSAGTVGDCFSEYADEALGSGRGASLHWLRHTFATWITTEMRWPLKVAQDALGHQRIQTTAGYLHSRKGAAREAIDAGLRAVGVEPATGNGSSRKARAVGQWLALEGEHAEPQQPPKPTGAL